TRSDRDWSSDVCSSDLRPVVWKFCVIRLQQHFFLSSARRVLLVQIARATPARAEDDAGSVRRPHWRIVERGIECKPRGRATRLRSEERRVGKGCGCRWW